MTLEEQKPGPAHRYHFGVFQADEAAGELRRKGVRIRIAAQPFQVLLLLLDRPGQLLTREEISAHLWPEGTFVDYEHGVNAAVNRVREALGDSASNPRFVETLARRGYRFIAPVEQIPLVHEQSAENIELAPTESREPIAPAIEGAQNPADSGLLDRILASPQELPRAPQNTVRTLFLLLELMYLGFYVGALANLAEIEELLAPLPRPALALNTLIATAAILIPARAFVLCAVLFRAPGTQKKFLTMWPFLLVFDILWSLSPFLLLHHINFGLALACTTLLVYSPFAQRSLVLMGAASKRADTLEVPPAE